MTSVVSMLLLASSHLSAQQPCPPPVGYDRNPLSKPIVTASEVARDDTAANLREFAVTARDSALSIRTQLEWAYASCLMRQEGGDWRSGEIYLVSLSFNPPAIANPGAPFRMRVLFRSANMPIAGRLLTESAAREVLSTAPSDPASGSRVPTGACVALGCPKPSVGGHHHVRSYVMLASPRGQEYHLGPELRAEPSAPS